MGWLADVRVKEIYDNLSIRRQGNMAASLQDTKNGYKDCTIDNEPHNCILYLLKKKPKKSYQNMPDARAINNILIEFGI